MLSGFLVSFDWLIQSFKFEWKREGDPIMDHRVAWVKRSLWLLICCRWTWRPFRFLFFLRFFSISCDEFSFISLVFESSATCGENFFTIGQIQNNNFVWKMLMMIFIGLFLNLKALYQWKKIEWVFMVFDLHKSHDSVQAEFSLFSILERCYKVFHEIISNNSQHRTRDKTIRYRFETGQVSDPRISNFLLPTSFLIITLWFLSD